MVLPFTSDRLRKSLKLIGDGTITEKGSYSDNFMYREDYDNDFFLVVHGSISKPVSTRGYSYEIALYKNLPETKQIGGGYGSSGIISKSHPKYFHTTYLSDTKVFSDITLISNVCSELIPYLKEKFINK